MVRLEKIIMQGFKSFSLKTEIPFPGGFVVIAGPNGSGKSNVVDALTFILGVTSAKKIRAQKLQNLIFSGGREKKPAESCEVTLEIDNSDGQIPGEDKEIVVSRRITRSGVSVYKLNGKTVMKSKILDLLANAKLSPDGYNIIMQGDVTRIIEMNPKERRGIIDDISGITEFNEKKADALHKMEKVEMRVRESMLIIAEKQRRVEQLKREKENAEKYQDLNIELRKANASNIQKQIETLTQEMALEKEQVDKLNRELAQAQKEFQSFEKSVEEREKEFKKISESLMSSKTLDVVRSIEQSRSEIMRKKDKIEFLDRQIIVSQKKVSDFTRVLPIEAVRFSSILKVPEKYSFAVQAAVASHGRDLIVKTFDDGIKAIRFLKDRKLGKARFVPLDRIEQKQGKMIYEKGVVGLAINLIEYDAKYHPAVSYVIGDTLIIEDIETAKNIRRARMATLSGDLVEKSGAMIGGWIEKQRMFAESTENLENEKARLESEILRLQKELEKLEMLQTKEAEQIEEMKIRMCDNEKELLNIRNSRRELTEKIFSIQSQTNKIKIERARAEGKLEDLKNKKKQFKDVTEFFDLPLEELQRKISHCISEIRKIGPVNMRAVEEYEMVAVEFEEMKKKLDKLLEEKNAVLKTIEEVEKKRYEKFTVTLNEIAKNFSQVYADMMRGQGIVRLEEPNNIDSGLVIEASPAGKRVVDLDVMSGGEKTMASLAFLFAIMQHYSSPFYVLDEVDAALDKVNTSKIAELVKKYSKKTQFIVISHNDIMTASADKVFGCAMQDGVTKVFGLEMPKR